MKYFLLIIFSICQIYAIGQKKTFFSSATIKQESTFKTYQIYRNIIIAPDTITVTHFWNGGKDDAKLKIDKVAVKEYLMKGICKWYYCTSTVKDTFYGYEKVIVIVSENQKYIDVFNFADEVTVFHSQLQIIQ